MTVLEKFVSFVKRLPAEQLGSLEANLADLMASYSEEFALTDEEISEIDKRIADPNPQFASQEEIVAIFGKPFSA